MAAREPARSVARTESDPAPARPAGTEPAPAEHALLGLLALAGGTAYGYDLARAFHRGEPLGEVIRLGPAMLYKHLRKLDRLGWVRTVVEEQERRPARRLCTLTPAGEAELRRWLAEPVGQTRELRLAFLVKLYFARRVDPGLAARLVAEQRRVVGERTAALAAQLGRAAADPAGDPFLGLVLELRLMQTEAAATWLDRAASSELPGAGDG